MESTIRYASASRLTKREQLVIIEIGLDRVDTASSFVEYMSESYGFSRSSVWYILKRLKGRGVLDFATKGEPGKALELAKPGREELRLAEKAKKEIVSYFTDMAMRETSRMYGSLAPNARLAFQ